MAFVPKTAPFSGKINAVTLGTGDKAIVIGGQNVLPFYTFDAPIENAPKVGVEVSDQASSWNWPELCDFYAGCTTMAQRAAKAAENSDNVFFTIGSTYIRKAEDAKLVKLAYKGIDVSWFSLGAIFMALTITLRIIPPYLEGSLTEAVFSVLFHKI